MSSRVDHEEFVTRVVDYYDNTASRCKKKTVHYFQGEGRTRAVVYRILSRYRASGQVKFRPITGRPVLRTTPEIVEQVEKELTQNPDLSVRAAAKKLNMARSTLSEIKVKTLGIRSLKKKLKDPKVKNTTSGVKSRIIKNIKPRVKPDKTKSNSKTVDVSDGHDQNQNGPCTSGSVNAMDVEVDPGNVKWSAVYNSPAEIHNNEIATDTDAVPVAVKKISTPKLKPNYFIAIHLGAGKHSQRKQGIYLNLCKSACIAGLSILKHGGSAEDAAVAATVILENSALVNAGRGSNLTLDKTVECDAGFMSGDGHFAGVGGVPGVQNPILIAQKLVQLQTDSNKLSCGRVPPNFLTGLGAKQWAESQGIKSCDESQLISKGVAKTYEKLMKKIRECADTDVDLSQEVGDTVGAVALDQSGRVAATVSSGGNWLKFPGRVGHSPQFGSGCWAMNGSNNLNATAISTTGVGEMLTKVQWARECANSLHDSKFMTPVEAIASTIQKKFLESELLRHHTEVKLVGMIGLTWDGRRGELTWGHTSQTMIVGYAGSAYKTPKMEFLSLPSNAVVGKAVTVGAVPI